MLQFVLMNVFLMSYFSSSAGIMPQYFVSTHIFQFTYALEFDNLFLNTFQLIVEFGCLLSLCYKYKSSFWIVIKFFLLYLFLISL